MPLIGWIVFGLFALGTGTAIVNPQNVGITPTPKVASGAVFHPPVGGDLDGQVKAPTHVIEDTATIYPPVWK